MLAKRGGERDFALRIAVLFVFLNSMYLPIPQIMWPPLFLLSAFLLQQRSTACPCPLFYRPDTVYTTFIIRNIYPYLRTRLGVHVSCM